MLSDQVPYYILDFLQQVPSVYVDGLGRFEAIFHPAMVDMPQARIKPPYIEPTFRDDPETPVQTLADYILYVSGPSVGSPKEAIAAFVETVQQQTRDGSTYTVEKFGTFSRNPQGNLRFTPDWDAFNLSFSGLEVLDLKPEVIQPTAPVYFPPAREEVIVHEPSPDQKDSIDGTGLSHQEEHVDSNVAQAIEEIRKHQDRIDESTSRLWWIILSSALVLIAILCAYLAWDIISNRHRLNDLKQLYPDREAPAQVPDTSVPADSTHYEVTPQPIPDLEQVTDTTEEVKETIDNPCFIVVGAFTDTANVTRMMARLNDLGYEAEQISGKTLTRVAIKTSCDQTNLQKVLDEARSNINPEAWIY